MTPIRPAARAIRALRRRIDPDPAPKRTGEATRPDRAKRSGEAKGSASSGGSGASAGAEGPGGTRGATVPGPDGAPILPAPTQDFDQAFAHLESIGLSTRNWTNTVFVAEALRRGLEVTKSKRNAKRILVSHGGVTHSWNSGVTTINQVSARRIVSYKEVTSRLLINAGLSAPDNAVFPAGDLERAWAWGEALRPLVVKPRDGNQGTDVFVGIETHEQFATAFGHVDLDAPPAVGGHPAQRRRRDHRRDVPGPLSRRLRPASETGV